MINKQYIHTLFLFCIVLIFAQNLHSQNVQLTVPMGHSDEVTSLAISHNQKYILSGSNDEPIIIWDAVSGRQIKSYYGHKLRIKQVEFTADDNFFISVGADKNIVLWKCATGEQVRKFSNNGAEINFVKIMNNKQLIASFANGTILIWDLWNGQILKSIQFEKPVINFHFTGNDKKIVITNSKNEISLYNIETGKTEMIYLPANNYKSPIKSVISNNFNYLYVFTDTLKKLDVKTGNVLKKYSIRGNYSAIRLSDDMENMYLTEGKNILLYDLKNDMEIAVYNASTTINDLRIFAGNENFVTAGGNWQTGTKELLVWSNFKKSYNQLKGFTYDINAVEVTSDNKYIIAAGGNWNKTSRISCWNIKNPQLGKSFYKEGQHIDYMALSPDDKLIYFTSGQNISSWNYKGDSLKNNYSVKRFSQSLSVNSENKYLARTNSNSQCEIIETETGKKIKSINDKIICVKFSPVNSDWFITGNENGLIQLWNINKDSEIKSFTGLGKYVISIDFSADGKFIAAGGMDNKVAVWNVATGELVAVFTGHTNCVNTVKFSKNGKYLVSASGIRFEVEGRNGEIILWNLADKQMIHKINGHHSVITDVRFLYDDKFLISGSWDNTMKIWSIASGKEIAMLVPSGNSDWTVVTPEGFFDASSGAMSQMYFTKGLEIIPLESFFEKYYKPNLLSRLLAGEIFVSTDLGINSLALPPKVKINIPENSRNMYRYEKNTPVSESDKVKISVNISNANQNISELRFFQNDKLIFSETGNFEYLSEKDYFVIKKEYTVTLTEGDNLLKVIAINNQRTESVPDTLRIRYQSPYKSIEPECNLYIFSIGINKYKNPKYNLNYCLSDAMAFTDSLKKGSTSIFANTFTYFLSDNMAAKDSIVKQFGIIKNRANAEDVFIFFYAGHGVLIEDSTSEFYLIPHNVTSMYSDRTELDEKAISAAYLRDISRQIKAQKQLFIMDACQSGGAVNAFASRGAAEEKAILQLARSAGIILLSASGSDQFATEFKELQHGVFTYSILEALHGEADRGKKDNRITVYELKTFIDERVPELTEKYGGMAQYPQCIIKGMDFPLIIIK